jgi:hypothetical protein
LALGSPEHSTLNIQLRTPKGLHADVLVQVKCCGGFNPTFRAGDEFPMTRRACVRATAAVNAPHPMFEIKT